MHYVFIWCAYFIFTDIKCCYISEKLSKNTETPADYRGFGAVEIVSLFQQSLVWETGLEIGENSSYHRIMCNLEQ